MHPLVSNQGSLSCPIAQEAAGSWGRAGDTRDGTDVPVSHPQPREAVEEFAEEALFLPPGSSLPVFFSLKLCVWTHPPFHAHYICCLKSGDPTMSKARGIITRRCMRRRVFLLKISSVLLGDYRRARRAALTRLADKMAPG